MSYGSRKAGRRHRWVCTACGKHTGLDGTRYDLRDTSCVTHAVLCHADKRVRDSDGALVWWAVDEAEEPQESMQP